MTVADFVFRWGRRRRRSFFTCFVRCDLWPMLVAFLLPADLTLPISDSAWCSLLRLGKNSCFISYCQVLGSLQSKQNKHSSFACAMNWNLPALQLPETLASNKFVDGAHGKELGSDGVMRMGFLNGTPVLIRKRSGRNYTRTQEGAACLKQAKSTTRIWACWHADFRFPTSKTVGEGFLLLQQHKLRQHPTLKTKFPLQCRRQRCLRRTYSCVGYQFTATTDRSSSLKRWSSGYEL